MLVLFSPLDGASVLACAYQLKVQSKNPKNFEYWFCQRPTGKIRNDFKQHQRGRWRYLALFAPICWRTLPSVCLISLKNTPKTHRTLMSRARVRKRTPAYESIIKSAVISLNVFHFKKHLEK